ncbi:class I poly(R)-hydroxyalkanoic acid synthase [Photobacterium damselae subsp. piscicida]|uniref:Class I poly(R)-hydroxyalkanoic acid synthase n=1 Tax=Photobacterium damsela subsp. piscicida TaxID=38294 RepID=A0A1Q9H4A7_PHODP|nr:class I poly(R)-hydroxyalkanoic acid synthase [Photobacterium damselae]OLQ82645.1 class I poly(R)-hydroxyalkanoic acid synthase [Photobacterium damselae subsp. piscicida]PSV77642.1 class I poly(R)-hydroxyalkanoic acid synthase [Photobacterium damselae]PSW79675.1 class I poly(R)-hydroxyalkanoic acid synthase [Photobacterium damselae]QOD51807.1 class I poly(R)-hydroxyalkanoic acid synthase [Photobacterium damselae subsp. piscicida]QOD55663.1 class I poly(R)-hydroxyalkanoic acid synthase [Phot
MYQNFFSDYLVKLQETNQQWWHDFEANKAAVNSPLNKAMQEVNFEDTAKFFEQAANQPAAMLKVQTHWWEQQLQIWQNLVLSDPSKSVVEAELGDKRFANEAWQNELLYNFIKQSYLLFSKTYQDTIDSIEGVDEKTKERISFFSRQAINALSPSNFIVTNPELLKMTLEQNGENLIAGLEKFKEDIESSADILKVRMTNNNAFRIGDDIATTEGDVVYRNDLFELIQYRPLTEKVHATPLLIVPPFINKYYILDLTAKNSMVRWLLEQGHSVFMMSWRNPGKAQADTEFGDYITDGVVKAVSAIEDITGQQQVNAAGYCIGGTLLACTVAYYAAKRMKKRIKSASFFTTILDFSQPGEIGAFVNDTVVSAIEQQNKVKGYMDGRSLSVTFSMLRENSLYWNYYVDNYLKGKSPVDFDLLYWNSDSTNVAGPCHNFLLRDFYLENKLIQDKGVKIDGVWMDLNKIKIPSYFISTKEDHIALWQGTYRGALLTGGNKTFVLGASGHVAGIVNPPNKNKYGYWTNDNLDDSADEWLTNAEYAEGSWWTHWDQWLSQHNRQEQVEPYSPGSENYPVIDSAPGQYVKQVLPITE